jgi:hypothetical protein
MHHDGTDGFIVSTNGAMRLYAPNNFIVMQDALGFLPLSQGGSLGANGFRWSGAFINATFTPGSSVIPANNGEVTYQLTSDTLLTMKVRGSDGVLRSGSITLS